MSVRKRTWTISGGAVALALTVTAAGAVDANYSANFVMPGCRVMLNYNNPTFNPTFQAGLCQGLVAGAYFAVYRRPDECADVPKDATNEQLIRVVVRYTEMRPQKMHQPFIGFAMAAMIDAWPCKK
jgi:hypothetical protein